MPFAMFVPTMATSRRRGRPRSAESPRKRADQVQAVGMLLAGSLPPKRIAWAFKVTRMTLYRWKAELLAEDSADADELRRLQRRARSQADPGSN